MMELTLESWTVEYLVKKRVSKLVMLKAAKLGKEMDWWKVNLKVSKSGLYMEKSTVLMKEATKESLREIETVYKMAELMV